MEGKGKGKGKWRESKGIRKGKGKGKVWESEIKRREREGKGNGRERKGKGMGREREGEGNHINFCSFGSFRNGFEIPKQTETNQKRWIYSFGKNTETEPKLSVFRFVSVRTERKKTVLQDTLQSARDNWAGLSSIISPSLWMPATWGRFLCLAMCLMMWHTRQHCPRQNIFGRSCFLINLSLSHRAVHYLPQNTGREDA